MEEDGFRFSPCRYRDTMDYRVLFGVREGTEHMQEHTHTCTENTALCCSSFVMCRGAQQDTRACRTLAHTVSGIKIGATVL